jgi:TonB family protein
MSKLILALLAFAVPGAAVAQDAAIEALPFKGNWVARYDRDACSLSAQFGEGDNGVIASFARYQPGDNFDLTLIGKRLGFPGAAGEADLDFGTKPYRKRDVMVGTMGSTPAIFFKSIRFDGWEWKEAVDPPAVTREMEKGVTGVTVSLKGRKPFRLVVVKGFGNPMVALRACMDDLIKTWGYDPAVQAALSRRVTPRTSPGSWIKNDDYPMMAIRKGASGLVQFRLDVDPKGKVAGCYILARTSPDEFADTTCRIMTKRARLDPAIDAGGKPVRSFFVSSVQFLLPY